MVDCVKSDRGIWNERLASGEVETVSLELLFRTCRDLHQQDNGRLVERLVSVLVGRAARSLRKRVGRNHVNGGEDIVADAVAKVVDAILNPSSADAAAFGEAFQVTLGRRLADQIRRSLTRAERESGFGADDKGEEIMPPDLSQATPEQAMIIQDLLLSDVDPRKRQALALSIEGYPASSGRQGSPSIASMLEISPRTAETWLREMRCLVKERMKE
jgi:DNA-directed RNA polymerase specialized sigma24 family protein